jgi:hypothetical protein
LKCVQFTTSNNAHLYANEIHCTWTPIEPISKDIQIGSTSSHIITRTQFPIQLATTCTIHETQGLTFDYLTFDLTSVYDHGLTYMSFSRVKKEKIFLFFNHYKWFFSNWSNCCHRNVLFPKNHTLRCIHSQIVFFILSIKGHDFCT